MAPALRTALLFSLCSNGLVALAQVQPGSQVPASTAPCTNFFLPECRINAAGLPNTGDATGGDSTGGRDQTGTPDAQRTRDANGLYVDPAGNLNRQGAKEIREPVLPPDPLTDFQRLTRSATGELLPIFGRDLFQGVPTTFAPGDQIAATPDYVIGPGDDLLLRVWGGEALNSQLTVDRSGAIYLPRVGAIHVAGLRFDELEKHIRTEMSRTYRNFNLSVNLGHLRSIQIYIVGEARRPGAYTISSLSTVMNALFVSGGPSAQGSLRHIHIRRAGQTFPEFDLYDLLLKGDKSSDVRLESGDTLFIPPVGAQVAVGGSIRHPAIYELGPQSTLGDILMLAGGFSSTASSGQIAIERIEGGRERVALTVTLDDAGRQMSLRDGDVLYAGHILASYQQSVTIRGNLANPGRFSWHPGMRLSEIIPDRRSLLTNDYWRERNRLGVPVPLFQPAAEDNLQRERVQGRQTQQSETQTPDNRINPNGVSRDVSQPDPSFNQNQASLLTLQGTERLDPEADRTQQTRNASNMPLPQRQNENETISPRSQNKIIVPTPEINWSYAVVERLNPDTLKSSLLPFNLGRLIHDRDQTQNLELQPGDIVTIVSQSDFPVPQDSQTKYIRLEGEFAGSGVYSVGPDESLEELVQRAGGLTTKAYLYGSSFIRESARVFQQQRLDEYISTLSADMERSAASRAASSASGVLDPNALAEQRMLIAQLRQLHATGRVVLEFAPISKGTASIPHIPLENGDTFRVPSRPNTISVIGAVYGQNVFLYNSGRKLEDYIALAGNPNRVADRKHAFIIRADGSIYSRDRAKGILSNSFDTTRINPGDSIVIPERLIKPSALRQFIDYSQILSSFGLAAAAINVVR